MNIKKLIDPDAYYMQDIFNQPAKDESNLLFDIALEMFNVTREDMEPLINDIIYQKTMLLEHIIDNEINESDEDGYTLPDLAKALDIIKNRKCETVHFSIHFDKYNKNKSLKQTIPLEHSILVEKLFNAFLEAVNEIDLSYDNVPKKPGAKPKRWTKTSNKDYVKQALEFIKNRPIPEPSENKYYIFAGIVLVLTGVLPPMPKDNYGDISSKYDGKYKTYLEKKVESIVNA